MAWHLAEIPDLSGGVAVVTGGNVGLGLRSSLELARKRAIVVIACRNPEKGQAAAERIGSEIQTGEVDHLQLDLTDAKSIAEFAAEFARRYDRLDILLNNAGVVNLERLTHTPDGREMHMVLLRRTQQSNCL